MNPLAVSINTAAAMVELSADTIRKAITSGQLPARKSGRAIRVEVSDLTEWFRGLEPAA
jgi:excisionase family DNA binding protein